MSAPDSLADLQQLEDCVNEIVAASRAQLYRAFNAGRELERKRVEQWRAKAQQLEERNAQVQAALDRLMRAKG